MRDLSKIPFFRLKGMEVQVRLSAYKTYQAEILDVFPNRLPWTKVYVRPVESKTFVRPKWLELKKGNVKIGGTKCTSIKQNSFE